MKEIGSSVGRGGKNVGSDVKIVQKLLNDNIGSLAPYRRVSPTGVVTDLTIALIEEFQRRILNFTKPDGRVDPNGKTIKALNKKTNRRPSKTDTGNWDGDSSKWPEQKKLNSLNTAFRVKVKKVIANLKEDGFEPKIFFGWRSVETQLELHKKGVTKVKFSFHNATKNGEPNAYAADIIDKRYGWSDKPETKKFWDALGKHAKAEGLYWGGDWTSFKDYAHIQFYQNAKLASVKKESEQ